MLTLIQIQGDGKGRALRFRGGNPQAIGRRVPRYQLNDTRVSRQHAQIDFDHGSWRITDLNSSNGTYLNAQRVDPAAPLRIGDHIQIGRLLFEVTTAAAPGQATATAPPPTPDHAPAVEPVIAEPESTGLAAVLDTTGDAEADDLDLDAILGLDEESPAQPAVTAEPELDLDLDLDPDDEADQISLTEQTSEPEPQPDQAAAQPELTPPGIIDLDAELEAASDDESSLSEATHAVQEPDDLDPVEELEAPPAPVGLSLEHPAPIQPETDDTPEAETEAETGSEPANAEEEPSHNAAAEPQAVVQAEVTEPQAAEEDEEIDGLIASLIDEPDAEPQPEPDTADPTASEPQATDAPHDAAEPSQPEDWTTEQLDAALESITGDADPTPPTPSSPPTEPKAQEQAPDASHDEDDAPPAAVPGFDAFVSDWLESEKPTDQPFDAEDWQPAEPQPAAEASEAQAEAASSDAETVQPPAPLADQATQLRAMAAAFDNQAEATQDAAEALDPAEPNDSPAPPQTPGPAVVTLLGPTPGSADEPPQDPAPKRRKRAALLGLLVLAPLAAGAVLWQTVGKDLLQPQPVTGTPPHNTPVTPDPAPGSTASHTPGNPLDPAATNPNETAPPPSAFRESVLALKSTADPSQDAATLFSPGPAVQPRPAQPQPVAPSPPTVQPEPAPQPTPVAPEPEPTPNLKPPAQPAPQPVNPEPQATTPTTPTTPTAPNTGGPAITITPTGEPDPTPATASPTPVGPLAIAEPDPSTALEPAAPFQPQPVDQAPVLLDVESPVVFLVDASGSLVDSMPLALAYLNQQVQALPESADFTVIFFQRGEAREPFKPGLRPASLANKRALAAYLDPTAGNIRPEGRSSFDQALTLALTYQPKTLYILSDNALGRSDRSDPDSTADAVLDRLDTAVADLKPVIHTVQFFYEDPDGLLRSIANNHDGRFQLIRGATAPVQIDSLDLEDLLTR